MAFVTETIFPDFKQNTHGNILIGGSSFSISSFGDSASCENMRTSGFSFSNFSRIGFVFSQFEHHFFAINKIALSAFRTDDIFVVGII